GLKMFLGYAETIGYLRELAASAAEFDGVEVFVLPSFPVLAAARELLAGSPVRYGAQDAHWEESGAYTGCVSPAVLRELGCTFVEIGHAERRHLFGENDDMVARKAHAAVRCGLEPIVCVGEEHETDGAAASIVGGQAAAVLALLPSAADVVIAYEPVWAIGAETAADPERVASVVAEVRRRAGAREGDLRILYGGSVGPGEIAGLLAAGVDGVFVGRAATAVSGLREVIESVRAAA
ncbi:MAG: triose-phosphate isomerase family protein, partial [Gaiellales bacterium]